MAGRESLNTLRDVMVGAGVVVTSTYRPSVNWMKHHRGEVVAFVIIAGIVILMANLYHQPHDAGLVVTAANATIIKAVGDHAPCPGTNHANTMSYVQVNGTWQYQYLCHSKALGNDSWFAAFVMLVALVLMVRNYPADLVMLAATLIMFIGGVIPAEKAFYGFSSSTVMSVASMFIVVKCLEENGSVDAASRIVLGKPKSLTAAVLRLSVILAIVSAFVLTSPLVTMFIPVVQAWSARIGLAPIQLMMPLSFASIIGGCITIIGAPVNLLIISLARDQDPNSIWEMFDPAPVAIPCTIVAIVYMTVLARFLGPKTSGPVSALAPRDGVVPRIFYSTFTIPPGSSLVGQNIGASGVKQARDMALLGVKRDGPKYSSVADEFVLIAGDVLLFCGLPEGIAQMRREKSLEMVTFTHRITHQRYRRRLIEVAVAETSPLIGVRLDDPVLADLYSAVVVGIRPINHLLSGEVATPDLTAPAAAAEVKDEPQATPSASHAVVKAPVGAYEDAITFDGLFAPEKRLPLASAAEVKATETTSELEDKHHKLSPEDHMKLAEGCWHESYKLQAGDAIVVEAHEVLAKIHQNSDHFSGLRIVTDSKPPITREPLDQFRLYFGAVVLIVIIVTSAVNAIPLLQSACVGAMLLLACGSITMSEAFYSVKPRVLLTIIASFGLGKSLAASGLATWIAKGMIAALLPLGTYWVLWGLWLCTSLVGCLVGCYAVSVLMFPICVEAQAMMPYLSMRQFVVLVLLGSSTAYGTPLGYVTSIMVQQAAGMTWGHFAKFGFGLQFILGFMVPILVMKTIPATPRDSTDDIY